MGEIAGWSGKAKQSFAGRIPKRRGCERILPTVVPDIRRGDSRDGKRGREVESCEGEVVAARDWHGACLPGSAFWK